MILQPGALGDCILTLPLASLVKGALNLGGVDLIGHAEYVGILPGRSCVDGVRSIDSIDLHRLFVEPMRFELADHDPLIHLFSGYSWIITFLGEPGSDFEQNLIFTTNCSHSADVVTLPLKPPEGVRQHIAEIYTEQFARQSGLPLEKARLDPSAVQIRVDQTDRDVGVELLEQAGIDLSKRLVVIQPGSGGRNKCWRLENFLNVARTLRGPEIEVLFLLGPAEVERLRPSEKVHIHGVTRCVAHLSLPQVLGLLSCADAFIGNDSGVTHLAAGIGLRTIAIFGPTDPTVYQPLGPRVRVVRGQAEDFAERTSPELQKIVLDSLVF